VWNVCHKLQLVVEPLRTGKGLDILHPIHFPSVPHSGLTQQLGACLLFEDPIEGEIGNLYPHFAEHALGSPTIKCWNQDSSIVCSKHWALTLSPSRTTLGFADGTKVSGYRKTPALTASPVIHFTDQEPEEGERLAYGYQSLKP
jgi:hypothetical protein